MRQIVSCRPAERLVETDSQWEFALQLSSGSTEPDDDHGDFPSSNGVRDRALETKRLVDLGDFTEEALAGKINRATGRRTLVAGLDGPNSN
jgi:hypothetical protein